EVEAEAVGDAVGDQEAVELVLLDAGVLYRQVDRFQGQALAGTAVDLPELGHPKANDGRAGRVSHSVRPPVEFQLDANRTSAMPRNDNRCAGIIRLVAGHGQ